jgi:ketosteroid isomerase-like protein
VAARLTPEDYVEIRQLVARYAYAVDTGADDGNAYAGLFAPDGAFADRTGRETKGKDALAALARRNTRGPQAAFHFIVNHVIESSPEGATGKEYLLQLRMGDGERPNGVFGGGHYDDVYVKTPEGWRFKSRTYFESTSGQPFQPPPATVGLPRTLPRPVRTQTRTPAPTRAGPGLTAEDYIEIQQLAARYPYALDQNADDGASYANLFTPDAVFRQPRTEGRENLARMASRAPHGPNYTRHFLANHVIDATPDGATGRQYLVAVDIGESGQASSIYLGGHYEDVYARTPEGWRFTSRTFIASATGAEGK